MAQGAIRRALAGAAVAAAGVVAAMGLGSNEEYESYQKVEGMVDSTLAACPVENVTNSDRAQCLRVGQHQAKKLWELSSIGEEYKKACSKNPVACFEAIEQKAENSVYKKTASELKDAVTNGLKP